MTHDLSIQESSVDVLADASNEPVQQAVYFIVTQVKSFRVVYFTDDPNYQPPLEGDWYYVSQYQGPLPKGMTLRNCWGWRFNGGVFIDARDPDQPSAKESLLESNRRALLRILNEKIELIRAPYRPSCAMGEELRQHKQAEASAYLQSPGAEERYPLLQGAAVARGMSMQETAELICKRAKQMREMLISTERLRERFTVLIQTADNEDVLLGLRSALLNDVYPELTRQFRYQIPNTQPIDKFADVSAVHRLHEMTRLKALLREKINTKRSAFHSDYLHNEEALKYKARLARCVLAAGSQCPPDMDLQVLENYARAREIKLEDAATQIETMLQTAGQVLLETEQIKDSLLAEIDQIKTMHDIISCEERIEKIC